MTIVLLILFAWWALAYVFARALGIRFVTSTREADRLAEDAFQRLMLHQFAGSGPEPPQFYAVRGGRRRAGR